MHLILPVAHPCSHQASRSVTQHLHGTVEMYGVPSLPAAVTKSAYQSSDLVSFWRVRRDNLPVRAAPKGTTPATRSLVFNGGKWHLRTTINPESGMNCIDQTCTNRPAHMHVRQGDKSPLTVCKTCPQYSTARFPEPSALPGCQSACLPGFSAFVPASLSQKRGFHRSIHGYISTSAPFLSFINSRPPPPAQLP